MRVIGRGDWATERGKTFTGTVNLERMLPAQQQGGVSVSLVRFEDGAVTHWHIHPGEQVLVVLEGQGRCGTESETFSFSVGDVVYTPPGERHWHGAAQGSSMAHLSITTSGRPEWGDAPQLDDSSQG